MHTVDHDLPAEEWCAERRVRLNELIIVQLLQLSEQDLRRVRGSGFVFARTSDVENDRMDQNTVRIVFGTWEEMEDIDSIDGRNWLMAFDFAVEYFGAPYMLHVGDPSEHPWNSAFDLESPNRIRAMLIQFLITMDPIDVLERDRRHAASF